MEKKIKVASQLLRTDDGHAYVCGMYVYFDRIEYEKRGKAQHVN